MTSYALPQEEIILNLIGQAIGEKTTVVKDGQKKVKKLTAVDLMRQKVRNKIKSKQEEVSQNNEVIWQEKQEQLLKELGQDVKTKSKVSEFLKSMKLKRQEFLKNIVNYQKSTFSIEKLINDQTNINTNNDLVKKDFDASHFIIGNALSLKAYTQGQRATCASLSAAKALEIMQTKKEKLKVSPQYLYWASKPSCQSGPCNQKGSWPQYAFEKSVKSSSFDIPSLNDCPYNLRPIADNETQTPLPSSCKKGSIKIDSYKSLRSAQQILPEIMSNRPVIVGLKLNNSFYDNEGFVGINSHSSLKLLDEHANGHAVVLIGVKKLPKTKIKTEGKYCFIAANSWGPGWAIQGHSCLSLNWLRKHLIPKAILVPTKIRVRS
jgi:C1A family cysteine protease